MTNQTSSSMHVHAALDAMVVLFHPFLGFPNPQTLFDSFLDEAAMTDQLSKTVALSAAVLCD